ncbi:hypothetical protein PoB_001915000 [Plakobranchus ocellatus]|uniref:Uncharacterized protein n=1 Tax=Plakobranchus ocellatus TaxID=259542 RepID=A0AAV3ZAT7_9GAST|nr:hypothetical protein PoB_001915000 [Plakobranchus ocellatus]
MLELPQGSNYPAPPIYADVLKRPSIHLVLSGHRKAMTNCLGSDWDSNIGRLTGNVLPFQMSFCSYSSNLTLP